MTTGIVAGEPAGVPDTAFQFSLIRQDGGKHQTLLRDVAPDACALSRFNTRKSRNAEDIARLAERMERNGFELTRALWATRNEAGQYEVFAGGTRLAAAKLARVPVAVILYDGYDDTEISRLADQDNENDEYHRPVSIVDVWAEYARLAQEEGWTQEKIGRAKGVSQQMAAYRIKLNGLPESVKRITNQGIVGETQLLQIQTLQIDLYFADWLTTEQAWLEMVDLVASGVKSNGSKTVRALAVDIAAWKAFITAAENTYESLDPVTLYDLTGSTPTPYTYDAPLEFVRQLAERKARSMAKVEAAEYAVRSHIKKAMADYQVYVTKQSTEAARQEARLRERQELIARFVLGDCLEHADALEDGSVRLLLCDPPYGQDYQSNRRWKSEAPPKLQNDTETNALNLLEDMLGCYRAKLATDSHLLIFASWQMEPAIRDIIAGFGFTVKGSLIWAKDEHSAGDVYGSFGPSHERIIHAVKGSPTVTPRLRDVFSVARDLTWDHPTVKPLPLLTQLIGSCTNENDLVIDPMAGTASTLVAAQNTGRLFWGCELSEQWHAIGVERIVKNAIPK